MQPIKRGRGRPVGSRVDPAQRRAALLDAAERAIRVHGPGVGVVDIANDAGFVRSAVYAMFGNRDELLAALSTRTAQRLLAEITRRADGSTDLRQRMSLFFDVVCRWMAAEPQLYQALGTQPSTGVVEELARAAEFMLTSSFDAQDPRLAAAAPWARAIVGSAVAAAEWWCRTGAMSRAELVEHLTALCWEGGAALPFKTDDIKGIDSGRQ